MNLKKYTIPLILVAVFMVVFAPDILFPSSEGNNTSVFDILLPKVSDKSILGIVFAIAVVLFGGYTLYNRLQDVLREKETTGDLQDHLTGENNVFNIPEGFGDDERVRKAVKYISDKNNPVFKRGRTIMPNFANGVLIDKHTQKIVKHYIACSRPFTDEFLKHYTVYIETITSKDDFETVICSKSDDYYFPPAVLTPDLKFTYVWDDEKKIEEFKQRGFIEIEKVNGDFMEYCHDVDRNPCTEKRILNQIYEDLKSMEKLQNYELHIHTNMSPCASCTALLKLQQSKFGKLFVTYDATMFNYDIEAVSKDEAEMIREITEKVKANYDDKGHLKPIKKFFIEK